MEKACKNCKYARLIYNEQGREKFVGCIRHQLFDLDSKEISEYCRKVRYFTLDDFIRTGQIFRDIPWGINRSKYDHIDSGIVVNRCLICHPEDFCREFEPRT